MFGSAKDSGTLFVQTVEITSLDAAYDSTKFYEVRRTVIQRYGIYNPYTGRGAIKGLLPHGPHNLWAILATHVLKQTASYEQASYAIQDTPDVVQQHYGRFMPQDKVPSAAEILNQVRKAACRPSGLERNGVPSIPPTTRCRAQHTTSSLIPGAIPYI